MTQAGLDTFFVYSRAVEDSKTSIETLVINNNNAIINLLRNLLNVYSTIKARFVIRVTLVQQKIGELKQTDLAPSYFVSHNHTQIKTFIFEQTSDVIRRLNTYNTGSSSWSIASIESIDVHIAKYQMIRGGKRMKTPRQLLNKHGLINIPTDNSKCFAYCAIACYEGIRTKAQAEKLQQYKDWIARSYNDVTGVCSKID